MSGETNGLAASILTDILGDADEDLVLPLPPAGEPLASEQRKKVLLLIGDALGFDPLRVAISRAVQVNLESSSYRLHCIDRRGGAERERVVSFSNVRELRNQHAFADRVFEALQLEIPTFKLTVWKRLLANLARCFELEQNFDRREMILSWLEAFLNVPVVDDVNKRTSGDIKVLKDVAYSGRMVDRMGKAIFKRESLFKWVTLQRGAKINECELSNLLRLAGFRPVDNVGSNTGGGPRKLSGKVWIGQIPTAWLTFDPPATEATPATEAPADAWRYNP